MRFLVIAIAACVLLVGSVGSVSAVPPDREPLVAEPLEFAAGDVCEFALLIETTVNRGTFRTFYDRNGDVRVNLITGSGVSRYTNLETGESIELVGGGVGVLSDPGDGTFVIDARGLASFYFFPGDQTPVGEGSGLWVVSGRARSVLDLATNVVTSFESSGRLTDICAALEG